MHDSVVSLHEKMRECNACGLREGCTQVVTGVGQTTSPVLLVVGEAPGQQEDLCGEPFVGMAGQMLRDVLRGTRVINRTNTLLINVLGCRPPRNKFPSGDIPLICTSKWLGTRIAAAAPDRMLLLGSKALRYVAGMTGITARRGNWYKAMGVRTMATYHPSYVLRMDRSGDMSTRDTFERDVQEVADEVAQVLAARAT